MRHEDLEVAASAMRALDLIDQCSVLCLPLLEDREQTTKAIVALMASIVVLSRRLPDEELQSHASLSPRPDDWFRIGCIDVV
jgi:hypothetical protein